MMGKIINSLTKNRNVLNKMREAPCYLYFIVAVLSAAVFCVIYGFRILDPTYTDWLLTGGDLSQHYIGWQAFRAGKWCFPIGLTDILAYPEKTSIIFTDSIPVFAVLFKVLSPILPDDFQYFGWWGLLCFVLQGVFSCKIVRSFTKNRVLVVLGSLIPVFSVTVVQRMYGHTALAGQWILILTLDLVFSYEAYHEKPRKAVAFAALIGCLASSIHLYFVLMCGIIIFAFCVQDVYCTRKIKQSVIMIFGYCSAALIIIVLLGGFSSDNSSFGAGGLGMYSMNFNALFNSQGWSAVFKELPTYGNGQYEGFAYLGAGVIFLLLLVPIVCFEQRGILRVIKEHAGKILSIGILIIIGFLVAASPVGTMGDTKLYELPLPGIVIKAWSVFRASGRVAWVVDYTLLFALLEMILRNFQKKTVAYLFVLCLFLQIYDFHEIYQQKRTYFSNEMRYESPLTDEIWSTVGRDDEIQLVIPYRLDETDYYSVGEWALQNQKTLNSFAVAHVDPESIAANVLQLLQSPQPDQIFVFRRDIIFDFASYDLNYYDANDFIIGCMKELGGVEKADTTKNVVWEFADNRYLQNGEDREDGRHLYNGGLSYGPYCALPSGDTEIVLYGENLKNNIRISVCGAGGAVRYEHEILEEFDDRIKLKLWLEESVSDLEVVVQNVSDQDVILHKMEFCLQDTGERSGVGEAA